MNKRQLKGYEMRRRSRDEMRARIEMHLRQFEHPDTLVKARRELVALERARLEYLRRNFLSRYRPLRHQRDLFRAGSRYRVRATFGGNRSGKTIGGCAETAYHATGLYPDDWEGKVFTLPPKIWVCGKSFDKVKNALQKMLFGTVDAPGTGFIPANRIIDWDRNPDEPGAVASVRVRWGRHGSGESLIVFKAYSQGRDAFESEKVQVIHMDEEPPEAIYNECLMRLFGSDADGGGIMYLTFTPLSGMTRVCKSFLRRREFRGELEERMPQMAGIDSMMWHQHVSWEDNEHLSELQIAEMILSMSPEERQAREKGIPQMGTGLIFPFTRDEICVRPMPIPSFWKQGMGLDHGFRHPAALVKWAMDPNSGTSYMTWAWKKSEQKIAMMADVIKASAFIGIPVIGGWDGENATQGLDGRSIHDLYRDRDIDPYRADKITGNMEEGPIIEFFNGLANGTIKVFGDPEGLKGGPCEPFLEEIEYYHRNDKGVIVREDDDAISAAIYAYRHRDLWESENAVESANLEPDYGENMGGGTWMSA